MKKSKKMKTLLEQLQDKIVEVKAEIKKEKKIEEEKKADLNNDGKVNEKDLEILIEEIE